MIKNIFFLIGIILLTACNQQEQKPSSITSNLMDSTVASLYPFNNQWIELQSMQYVNNSDGNRDFKSDQNFSEPHLKTISYSKWCEGEYCYQLDEFNTLEKIQSSESSEIADPNVLNYLIPLDSQIIAVSSLPTENIFTIKAYDRDINELWNTIFERSRNDSNGVVMSYAKILGYNNHVLAYHSSFPQIRKSGYLDLSDGRKKQAEEQWNALIIDEDFKTILGEVIQNVDLSYAIRIGNDIDSLPSSISGFTHVQSLLNKNNIYLGFYYEKSNIAKILVLDYHTGNTIWTAAISSSKPIEDIYLSVFQNSLILETVSNSNNGLYIYRTNDGQILGKF
ncbi:MAG: hypothetical protein M9958_02455 [Chitinophagales bacterium]|nr:hypothetical protein [Chitinophagales bacterium]